MATTNVKKKLFFLVFCLASVTQGMYSTYFVSILTTIERLYQIQSKTAGAIISATEIGQILGALVIAYYGGKGDKPKWIAGCMTLTALAALISTSPHFLLLRSNTPPTVPTQQMKTYLSQSEQALSASSQAFITSTQQNNTASLNIDLCYLMSNAEPLVMNSTHDASSSPLSVATLAAMSHSKTLAGHEPIGWILTLFAICLLAIGFGSTAITTLGIPLIDEIVSKEDSPLYLGLTISLRIFGPALGFLLGSFCIGLDVDWLSTTRHLSDSSESQTTRIPQYQIDSNSIGAWWLGLIIISLPLLLLALPIYYLSRQSSSQDSAEEDQFGDITYQAAEDHDIGGSRDFQPHILHLGGDLDITSNQTCYSEVDSSSREVLQVKPTSQLLTHYINYGKNITLEQPILVRDCLSNKNKQEIDNWKSNNCLIVEHFGGLQSTSFTNDEIKSLNGAYSSPSSSSAKSSSSASLPPPSSSMSSRQSRATTMNLWNSLSRLIKNKLLLLRMLSGIMHILPIAGFYTFLPKYLTEQFRIAPSSASAISGLAGILFVGFGAFLGGTIIRMFNINSKQMARWIAISSLLYVIGMLVLMNLGCPENQTVHYQSEEFGATDCALSCRCSGEMYNPVCANGTSYMSPCLAGCKSHTSTDNGILFEECGCSTSLDKYSSSSIPAPPSSRTMDGMAISDPETMAQPSSRYVNLSVATQGHCLVNCDNLVWYIVIFSIFTLIHASCEVGSMMFNLRCVNQTDRTMALGLITFASSLLGEYNRPQIHNNSMFVHEYELYKQPANCDDGRKLSRLTTFSNQHRHYTLLSNLWQHNRSDLYTLGFIFGARSHKSRRW